MSRHLHDKIDDLIVQAIKERSHYYTGSTLKECKVRLVELEEENKDLKQHLAKSHERYEALLDHVTQTKEKK